MQCCQENGVITKCIGVCFIKYEYIKEGGMELGEIRNGTYLLENLEACAEYARVIDECQKGCNVNRTFQAL